MFRAKTRHYVLVLLVALAGASMFSPFSGGDNTPGQPAPQAHPLNTAFHKAPPPAPSRREVTPRAMSWGLR